MKSGGSGRESGRNKKLAERPAGRVRLCVMEQASMEDRFNVERLRHALRGRSIVMVGLMGCGKSSIGKRLAVRLNVPFIDSDEEIERVAQKSIAEIFQDHGEAFFRDREARVISRLLQAGPQVLATGGGAFMNPATRARIKTHGISIWLKAELSVLMRRVGKRETRPLLKSSDPEGVMRELMATRYPVYAEADLTIDSRDVPHESILTDILIALDQHATLAQPGPI